jgi:hypothetical protein
MPKLVRLVILGLLFVGMAPVPAYAQDIFIRQPNNNTKKGSVDYGVQPKTAPAPVPTPAPAPAPVQNTPPVSQPAPQATAPAPTPDPAQNTVSIPKMPLQVIQIGDDRPPIPAGDGPLVLSIAMQPGAIGRNDITNVSNALGLQEQEIKTNCFFEYDMLVNYGDHEGNILPLRSANAAQYRFTAPLTGVHVYPSILCKKVRAPVSGIVMEQGNYYKVATSAVDCPPNNRQGNTTLTFRYAGDGTGQCQYQ